MSQSTLITHCLPSPFAGHAVQDIEGQSYLFDFVPPSGHRAPVDHADAELLYQPNDELTEEELVSMHESYLERITIRDAADMIRQRLPKMVEPYELFCGDSWSSFHSEVRRGCSIILPRRNRHEIKAENWPAAVEKLVSLVTGSN